MILNVASVLIDRDGSPILENGEPVHARKAFINALLAGDANTDKLARFELFLKLRSSDDNTDLSADEVRLLETAVEVFPTLIMGQLIYLLNNKTVK